MEQALHSFCTILSDELERQRAVLEACAEQRQALFARDVPRLLSNSACLEQLIREAKKAELQRYAILHDVAHAFHLDKDNQTLSDLIHVVPSPWSEKLAALRRDLRDIVMQIRTFLGQNKRNLRDSLHDVESALAALAPDSAAGQENRYDAQGVELAGVGHHPALFDRRG